MNYTDKKNEIGARKARVLAKYEDLFRETMELAVDMATLLETTHPTSDQQEEWALYLARSVEADSIFRLASALQYVKDPTNEEVVSTLIENIEVNHPKMKIKRMK